MSRKNQNKRQTNSKQGTQARIGVLVDQLFRLTTKQNEENVSQKMTLVNQLYQVLNEIRALEKENEMEETVNSRCNATVLSRFTQWLTKNGANFDGIKIEEFEGYELGLLAERDVEESSLIITVPEALMMTIDAAEKSELGYLLETDPMLKNMPNVALAIFLLLENFRGKSFWKPYMDILPTVYSTVLYFSLDELQDLQVSSTLESSLKQIANIVRQYAYFYKLIWTFDDAASRILRKKFTFNYYRWAVSTVMTRQNAFLSTDESKCVTSLIPLWDMCNHMNGHISTNYNPQLKRSECFAMKNFKAGEQLFIFYGARSNAELFTHNGFVYENNEHDGYQLKLGISKVDPLKEQRVQLLEKLSLANQNEYVIKSSEPQIGTDLLAFLRVFNMDKEQLQYWLEHSTPNNLKSPECAFDTAFETKYWGFLFTRLKLILASYKTSLEEDTEVLKTTPLPHNKRLAVQMRMGEKKILLSAMRCVEEKLKN
ncbi:hypothetical protein PPYR_10839 [Photinus pyralis]|uniref:protein-histidine N-methyltransferase n=1 Tax=Photinus pyralis TaxID=7054 RepID=A0A5N4AHT1_PHOPY|nr:actin-histidine N-methyltransferase [Photinus pyralis]KAB0796778.1 hypothetical protein PPYR_10839 [Photinus pyralis]